MLIWAECPKKAASFCKPNCLFPLIMSQERSWEYKRKARLSTSHSFSYYQIQSRKIYYCAKTRRRSSTSRMQINVTAMTQDKWHRTDRHWADFLSPESSLATGRNANSGRHLSKHSHLWLQTIFLNSRCISMRQSKFSKWKYSLWMSPTPAKSNKLFAQKLSLISSCCCKENPTKCQ